jgi:hypothetical protein
MALICAAVKLPPPDFVIGPIVKLAIVLLDGDAVWGPANATPALDGETPMASVPTMALPLALTITTKLATSLEPTRSVSAPSHVALPSTYELGQSIYVESLASASAACTVAAPTRFPIENAVLLGRMSSVANAQPSTG